MSGAFLKCDAADCGHVENVPAVSRDLIGMPCPKCGANLLTEKDCEDWLAMIQPGIDLMRSLGLLVDQPNDRQNLRSFGVHLHDENLSVGPVKGRDQ